MPYATNSRERELRKGRSVSIAAINFESCGHDPGEELEGEIGATVGNENRTDINGYVGGPSMGQQPHRRGILQRSNPQRLCINRQLCATHHLRH